MKLSYSKQITVCFAIILLFNVLTTVLKHWIFHSIGFILCGIIWILNPVLINGAVPTQKQKRIMQFFGGALIIFGIFSRAYLY